MCWPSIWFVIRIVTPICLMSNPTPTVWNMGFLKWRLNANKAFCICSVCFQWLIDDRSPLNESTSLPCSHEVIPQGSKSTHWQQWSGRLCRMHPSTGLALAHIVRRFALRRFARLKLFWVSWSESFPNLSLCRSTPLSLRYFSKYFEHLFF